MSNELMDFTARDNFDFFKFWKNSYTGATVPDERQTSLKASCQRVIEIAHKTTRDMCELSYHLKELKECNTWGHVINPKTGYTFNNDSFSDFCDYAFGFSQTMTSNLTRIAKFMEQKQDGAVGFIETKYEKFKKSCLIEIAAVSDDYWKYFTSDMTVADIRLAKDYIVHGRFYIDRYNTDFDLMTYARAYKEAKEAKKAEKKAEKVTPALSLDIIPGQISLDDMEEVQEQETEQGAPAPAKFDVGFSDDRFSPPSAWLQYHPEDEDDELDEARYDDREDLSETEEEEMTDEVSRETEEDETEDEPSETDEPSRYSFHNRDAIRAFFRDYRNWERNPATFAGTEAFKYRLKNGAVVIALETTTCKDIANLTAERTVVRYFWSKERDGTRHTYEVGTHELELYIKEIKDEL